MRRFWAPRAVLLAFLAVGCASFSSFASAQTILTGRFRSHVLGLGSGQTFLTGKIVTPFDVSDPSFGRLAGAFTVDFPDFTPPGRIADAGTSLVLDSPMLTHASLEITWTTPTQKAGSPENIFSSQIAAETWRPDLEDFRHSHCGTPLSNGEAPIQPGLVANTPYHFQVSADCTWTSLPFSKVGFGGDAVIDSSMFFDAFGLSATGAGPNLTAVARFIISTYDFPSSDLLVDHIEIVQTVQKADNSEPVFVGKSTVVRVFPKLTDANPANTSLAGVTGVLRGPGGKELTPFNPGKTVTAKLSPDREATNDSLNFALPPDWTVEGDLSLTAVLNPGRTVPESNYDNDSRPLPEPKHFDKSSPLRIAYFPLCYLSLQNCPSNAHCLQFSSGAMVLSRYCFRPSFDTQIRGTGDTNASGLDTASFSVKAPFPAGATRIALLAGTAELASAAQSAYAPKISITSPANGAVWSGANTLAWTASDEDGDPLTFSILTSADEGASWVPLQAGLTASQYSFDTAELSAGNKTLFEVLASDGFNTTAATVGPVTILPQPFIEATPGLDFGTVATGQSSTLPILLTNRGELAVKVTALTFDSARFSTDAAVPFSIAPGGSQSVNVNFRPTSTGPKTARLTIVSDDTARSPLTVSLSGSGACVSIGGSPCSSPRTPRTLLPRS